MGRASRDSQPPFSSLMFLCSTVDITAFPPSRNERLGAGFPPKSFYFQRLKKDYLGSHSQCSIPVLVVVDVSQNPHGSCQHTSRDEKAVGALLSKGDPCPGWT